MLKIGKDIAFDKNTGKTRKIRYRDVEYDQDGWIDATKFFPSDYDLVQVKTKNNKINMVWAYGNHWDGLKIKQNDEILYWKR